MDNKQLVKKIKVNKCWCGQPAEYLLLDSGVRLCKKHYREIENQCKLIYTEEVVPRNFPVESIVPSAFGKGIKSWAKGNKKKLSQEVREKIIDEEALYTVAEIVWENIPEFNKASYHRINVITKNDGVNIFFYSLAGKPLGLIDSQTGEILFYFSREN